MAEVSKPTQAIIDVRDLWFRYEGQPDWVLRGVDLEIHAGEFLAIIGQNGAGKTTLVKHFNGILRPVQGRVLVGGRDAGEIPLEEMATRVGYCYQNPDHQIFKLTVREELEFGLRNLAVPEDEIQRRIQMVLKTVELQGYEEEYPFALSRGQRQKLAVGSILAMNPPVMIIDEPTTGMDWRGGVQMMNLIKDLHASGHTIIMITHDMRIVTAYASRIVVMAQGQILTDGTPQEVFVQADVLRQAFIEAPQICRIAQALAESGLEGGILSVQEAVAAFKRLMSKVEDHVDAV
jgi:energy-coupling factor transporter ATP-binding protein EcfA2